MKNIFVTFCCLLFALISNAQNYKISREIRVKGNGKWDFLSVDEINQRLFVSHGDEVNVIDIKSGTTIATITDTKGVHGIAIANDLGKAFISNGNDNTVTIINLNTFGILTKIKIDGVKPDAILYDKFSQQVFVFNGKSANVTVLNALTNNIITNIDLGGKPELSVTNDKGLVYVNIEDTSQIKVIDTKTLKVVNSWNVSPGTEPTGLAIDTKSNRLFSGCANKLLVITDALNGKVISSLPIGSHCDGVVFDSKKHLIFSSNGEGNITLIKEESKDRFKIVQTLKTQVGAKTIALNNKMGQLYLPTASFGKTLEATADNPNPKPVIIEDSFKILIASDL